MIVVTCKYVIQIQAAQWAPWAVCGGCRYIEMPLLWLTGRAALVSAIARDTGQI